MLRLQPLGHLSANNQQNIIFNKKMAERARFELALGLLLNNISNVAPSTARPSLHIFMNCRYYIIIPGNVKYNLQFFFEFNRFYN